MRSSDYMWNIATSPGYTLCPMPRPALFLLSIIAKCQSFSRFNVATQPELVKIAMLPLSRKIFSVNLDVSVKAAD
jgi:hypothetical protein